MAAETKVDAETARELLAERLYLALEKLDPTPGAEAWADLGDERDIYRATIDIMGSERGLWLRLFGLAAD